jgi:excisionase family DNA binding protein
MVTLSEGEAFLGISHSTMKTLIRDGKVPSVKIGGSRRIPVDALLEVAKKGTE